jgi:hypothetical protein
MEKTGFDQFAETLKRLGSSGVDSPVFCLGKEGAYELRYIPFEHINRAARLVIVGITPGRTQIELAYDKAQSLLQDGAEKELVLAEIKKTGGFGGPSMRPNLLRMLRHFHFDKLLGIEDAATLWTSNAHLLHSTSVVPHAVFENGKPFSGKFDAVLNSRLLKQCFLDGFVASLAKLRDDALYIALGDCPKAALAWCVGQGHLRPDQMLGAFCHPSRAGGSATDYYLGEKSIADLKETDPIRHRTNSLDENYRQMAATTSTLLLKAGHALHATPTPSPTPSRPPEAIRAGTKEKPVPRKAKPVNEEHVEEIRSILDAIVLAGHTLIRQNKKVAEFETRSGQVTYLIKEQSRLSRIILIVHPKHSPADLSRQAGVASVTSEHRFHSNMTRFPKRFHKGETETPYGWQVVTESLGDCQRFLASF